MTNDVKKVPELRFPEFSGEWEEKMLGDVLTILDGDRGKNYPSGSDFLEYGHTLFLNASNVTKNGFSFTLKQYITEKKSISMGNGKLVKNDVVLTTRGSIGNIGWYDEEIYRKIPYARINSGMLILRSNNKGMASFVSQFLMSTKGKRQIDRISFGSAQPQLTKKDIKLYRIDFPQIKEQQKIGDFFSKLDHQIELEEEKLELLEQQKKSYMQKIFSQELRFKDENGNEYPEWEIKKLMQIAKVKTGSKNVQDNIQDGKYKFFDRSVEVKYLNTFDFDETAIIYPGEGSKFLPRYFSGKYSLHQRAYSIYDININNNYLYYYLSLQNNHFLKYAVGSTVKSLRMSGFDKLKVMVPKNSEQEKIGSFFKNLDEFIEKQANKVELLKQRKQSFLQKLFV